MAIITNTVCDRRCLYCSRFRRHIPDNKLWNLPLSTLEAALLSVRDYGKTIKFLGGEPLLHPKFEQMCLMIRDILPTQNLHLLTSGGKYWDKYYDLIYKTFDYIALNKHSKEQYDKCRHQPITVAVSDAVPDERVRQILIDNCWTDRTWCPVINIHGLYFCEIAAAIDDLLYDGANAWKVTPQWWLRDEQDNTQRHLCQLCGMCLPMERELISTRNEKISPGLLAMYNERGLPLHHYEIFDKQFTAAEIYQNALTWYPGNFREDKICDARCGEGRGLPDHAIEQLRKC